VKIRFLEMVDSGVDGFPFMPGQIIDVAKPSPWLLSYLDGVRAERLDETVTEEVAVAPTLETSEPQPVETAEASLPRIEHAVQGKRRRR